MVIKISKEKIFCIFLISLLSAAISISAYHLWGADWRVPIAGYRGDSVGMLLELSNYVKGGSIHRYVLGGERYIDSSLGGFGDSSIPMPLLKMLWRITGSVEAAINIHAVVNSIFLSLSMFWVCTRLKIRNCFSAISGVLYGSLSYFILYSNTLLMIYGICFYIPLFCYILIELMRTDSTVRRMTYKNAAFIMGVMLYTGMNSAYYAFFAMILLAYTMLYTLFVTRDVDSILFSFLSFIAIGMGIASYTIPLILNGVGFGKLVQRMGYMFQAIIVAFSVLLLWVAVGVLIRIRDNITLKMAYSGTLIMAVLAGAAYIVLWKYTDYIGSYAGRGLWDIQLGSLKAGAMVLPAANSAFGLGSSILGAITDIENMQASDIAEIGVVAGVGFAYSVIRIFQYKDKYNDMDANDEVLKICGLVNAFIVVVAINGGLSLLIGLFITSGIRRYNSLCVYIASFGLISSAILAEMIFDRIKAVQGMALRKILYTAMSAVLAFGIMLSIPMDFNYKGMFGMAEYVQRKSEYDEWYRYIGKIEAIVPEGGTILEFPLHMDAIYQGNLMTVGRAYELQIPAIIAKTTYWDYLGGGENGKILADMIDNGNRVDALLSLMCESGYQGIYIDTMMYNDDSYVSLIEELTKQLREPLICSENRRYFYSLADYAGGLYESDKQ